MTCGLLDEMLTENSSVPSLILSPIIAMTMHFLCTPNLLESVRILQSAPPIAKSKASEICTEDNMTGVIV